MVHLHIRDEKTRTPTLCAKTYDKLIAKIRKFAPDLMICVSLSARSGESFEKRAEPLFFEGNDKPDMASLTLSSMNFISGASINTPEDIQKLATNSALLERVHQLLTISERQMMKSIELRGYLY